MTIALKTDAFKAESANAFDPAAYDVGVAHPNRLGFLKRLPLRATLVAGAAIIAIVAGGSWMMQPAASVFTDDAYVKADSTIVAPKVQGLIGEILVHDNEAVHAGQPLIRIDAQDYAQAEKSAEADVAYAQAALSSQAAQEQLASANARAANAGIRSAEAQSARANADDARYDSLVSHGDVARRDAETVHAGALSAAADADKSRAAYAASVQQQSVVAQSRGELAAALQKAQAALALAKQNLEHTVIVSPVAGVVGDRQAQTGEYVQPGTQLMTIVPMDTVYLTANFKETQTARMLVGQHVRVKVDALPGKELDGVVESFAPASGSEFSLLPFEPATGNFTRVVQRVPVRIALNAGQPGLERLRPGLSAKVTVDLKN